MRGAIPDDEEVPIWDPEVVHAADIYVVDDDLLVRGIVSEGTDAGLASRLQAEEYDGSRSPSPILGDDFNISAFGQDDVNESDEGEKHNTSANSRSQRYTSKTVVQMAVEAINPHLSPNRRLPAD